MPPGMRKADKEPGKSATVAPPVRLGLSDKTAQAVFVDTEVSRAMGFASPGRETERTEEDSDTAALVLKRIRPPEGVFRFQKGAGPLLIHVVAARPVVLRSLRCAC